eukprot:scaffold31821_cov100-Skeletonema_dohrnii-CCMP3373.AAC.1
MNADLIVDFPQQRKRKSRAVHFAETAQLCIFKRPNVARHELFYTSSEYDLMILVVREDVLAARAAMALRGAGEDDVLAIESVCVMGIEHLLTPADTDEVRACRARCIRAVLTEQAMARSASATRFVSWETIALASFAQTRMAAMRARMLVELHQGFI